MNDGFGVGFNNNRKTYFQSGFFSLFGVTCYTPVCHGNFVRRENIVNLGSRKNISSVSFGSGYNSLSFCFVNICKCGYFYYFPAADCIVSDKSGQSSCCNAGQAEARNAAFLQYFYCFRPLAFVGHQIANNRLSLLFVDLYNLFRNAVRVHKEGSDKVDKNAVEIIIIHHGIKTCPVMSCITGGQNVNRIADSCFGV